MPIRLIAFDVGEVLVDETRQWGEWADRLGVSRLTFAAALGAVIAAGRHHRDVFDMLRPGFDLAAARREWSPSAFTGDDLYPDALGCLARLRTAGYRIAIVANQPAERLAELRRLGVEADLMASSEAWGVEKPAPEFFARLVEAAGLPAAEIAYVGDRVDNDALPANRAGLVAVFLRRGPWGVIQAGWPEAACADFQIDSLDELPEAFTKLPSAAGGGR
ncbi:MAG TPA: HAD family hydrolase [Stellaceae bacterium]|nr:HAD family hydrolase [Stellaceae bacterium]